MATNLSEVDTHLGERLKDQHDVEEQFEVELPDLTWITGVSTVPWNRFLKTLMTQSLRFVVIPVAAQLVWMVLFKRKSDVQYFPIGIPVCLLGACWAFTTAGPDHTKIEMDDPDASKPLTKMEKDDPDASKPQEKQHFLDGKFTFQTVFTLRWRAKVVIFVMSLVLYDSLFYPMGFLSHVQWHYNRCMLLCNESSTTTNSTMDCMAAEKPESWFPLSLNNDTISAPMFFNTWVYHKPVKEVADECELLLNSNRAQTATWKALLHQQHPYMHFFVGMTFELGISKVEIYGPILAGCILTLLIAAVQVEEFKIHQVGWARVALLDRIDQEEKDGHWNNQRKAIDTGTEAHRAEGQVTTAPAAGKQHVTAMEMAKDMVSGVDKKMQVKLIAQLFGIKEANRNCEEKYDPSRGLGGLEVEWHDVVFAAVVATLHSTLAGIWRLCFKHKHVFPFNGGYMWWLVMMKIAFAQGAILFLGYLVNIHTTKTYAAENTLYLLFQKRWSLCQTFQVERKDTRTIQVTDPFSKEVNGSAPATSTWMRVCTTPCPGKINDRDMANWLHLQELILLSMIAPRTGQSLHLWILILWFCVTFLMALSNFILEWPREFNLHPSDAVALMDFVLVGFLINKGMQLYVRLEDIKNHDLESLKRIDNEWDFFFPDLVNQTEDDRRKREIRWLVKARIHDLEDGRYSVSTSSRFFNGSNLKKTMTGIGLTVGTMSMRVFGNFLKSSMDH